MLRSWLVVVAGGLASLLMGCGQEVDVADAPFVYTWELDEHLCAEPVGASACYEVTLGVSNHEGESEASCRIHPLNTDGLEYKTDGKIAPDLEAGSAYHEVVVLDGFSIRAGDAPVFEVVLPIVEDAEFWRWQVICHPGAPG